MSDGMLEVKEGIYSFLSNNLVINLVISHGDTLSSQLSDSSCISIFLQGIRLQNVAGQYLWSGLKNSITLANTVACNFQEMLTKEKREKDVVGKTPTK